MSVVANLDIPNMPPTIQNFPNLVMFEDEIYNRSFDWLSNYIKDPNEPIDVLNLTFETPAPVTFTVDSLGRSVRVEPADNWYGKAMVDLAVVDNFGQMGTLHCLLSVPSVNDPPEPFELLFPPKDTMITEWFWPMTFKWQKTLDVDEGDSVMYSFYYSPFHSLRGPGTVGVSFLTDTTLMLNVQKPGVYYWGVYAEDPEKLETRCSEVFQISISTGVEEEKKTLPDDFSLDQNYPNPFNPLTTIQYSLPGTETVHLWVLDIQGRVVRRLVEEKQPSGRYSVIWDATDDRLMPVASGMYFIRIEAGRFI